MTSSAPSLSAEPVSAAPDFAALNFAVLNFSAAHCFDVQVRFSDTDQMQHINNAAYAVYLESARLALTAALGLPELRVVLARLELDYRREIKLGQRVQVQTLVTGVGRSSWRYAALILADGEVALEARSVQVQVGPDTRPVALSPEIRAALLRYAGSAT